MLLRSKITCKQTLESAICFSRFVLLNSLWPYTIYVRLNWEKEKALPHRIKTKFVLIRDSLERTLLSKIGPSPKNMNSIILQKYVQVHIKCTILHLWVWYTLNLTVMKKINAKILLLAVCAVAILMSLTAFSSALLPHHGISGASDLTSTPTIPSAGTSHAGSTDWITVAGVIIVLIVLLPVLFRRSTWTK